MMRHPLALTAILLLLTLYAAGIVDHDLWTPDEPRVAAVGKAAARGAWVAPTLNGTPFLEQPPLHAWCVGPGKLSTDTCRPVPIMPGKTADSTHDNEVVDTGGAGA